MMKPEEGAACEGIQGTRCSYGAESCRCRNTEPIWTCSDTAAAGSGGSEAGAGGRSGGFGGRTGGSGRGGQGRGQN